MDTKQLISAYKKQGARVQTAARVKLKSKKDFSLWYTPGVGAAATHLGKRPNDARAMSVKKNSVAVISDGSSVLGLGNVGPYAALPVLEGKALIFKERAGIDAWPIPLATQDPEEIVRVVKAIAPSFGGINLEDIAAPNCFYIEEKLKKDLAIPVMHDDQHGTAIAVLAGLINAAKFVKKNLKKVRVVISGAGAAGDAAARLLLAEGIRDLVLLDRAGTLYEGRPGLSGHKEELAKLTNPRRIQGGLAEAMEGADVFIGVSGAGLLKKEDVAEMAPGSIIFALANPVPEIMPDEAKRAGATVIATGRSDFPNQINNALVFPGVFRGALDRGVREITQPMKLRAAKALAGLVRAPRADMIIPDLLDPRVVKTIAKAIR